MKYLIALALVMPLGCQKDKTVAAGDPKFDQRWTELAKEGAEPLFIEGDLHGAGLMGEVRRAVEPNPEGKMMAPGAALPGPLPDGEVVRVIRQNLPGVKGCYQVEERAGTVGSGKAIVSIDIDPAGTVSNVSVDAPAFSASHLPACVTTRAKAWTFPKFSQGPKHFSYPFVFVGG